MKRSWLAILLGLIGIFGLILLISLGVGALINAGYGTQAATQFVEQSGYKNVHSTGSTIWFAEFSGCPKADSVAYYFTATAFNGQHVHVTVCKGLFGGGLLRQG